MTNRPDAPASGSRTLNSSLVFGLLAAPTAWIARLLISFPLIPYACEAELVIVLHLVSLAFGGVATAGLVVAIKYRRRVARGAAGSNPDSGGRDRFLALMAVSISAGSLLVIALESSATFLIDPCLR